MSANVSGLIALGMWVLLPLLVAFSGDMPAFLLSAIVFFIGFVTYTSFQIEQGDNISSYWKQPFQDYLFWILGPGLYTVLIFWAMKEIPIFEALILNYLWPILLVAFSLLINRTSISISQILGMLLGFAGIAALFLPDSGSQISADFHFGHGVAIFAAGLWALYSALARKKKYPNGFLAPVFLVFSALCLLIHLGFEKTIWPEGEQWIFIFLLGIFRISYVFWDYAMRKGDVILMASLSYFLPLLSSLLLMCFNLGPEKPGVAAGGILIILASLIVNLKEIEKLIKKFECNAGN